jgi:hypothetical protein
MILKLRKKTSIKGKEVKKINFLSSFQVIDRKKTALLDHVSKLAT